MNSEYKDIKTLINNLSVATESLENGNLSVEDIGLMLEEARELHERIAILQYQAGQPKVSQSEITKENEVVEVENNNEDNTKGELNFSFDFTSQSEEDIEKSNQTNLLDAIEEVPEIEIPEEEVQEIATQDEQENHIEDVSIDRSSEPEQTGSINDKFADRAEQETLAERLGKSPIPCLPEAIGLNQKFLFMNDLFEGENGLYKEAIQALDNFSSFIDADEYINTLAARHSWDSTSKTSKDFIELVERRYS